jgi:hypothetical protein
LRLSGPGRYAEEYKMREIKFKAYIKDGSGLIFVSLCGINPPLDKDKFEDIVEWTGLCDKNGNEIYEGDIVRCFNQKETPVVYKNGSFGYIPDQWVFISFAMSYHFDWIDGKSEMIEIVGNIYHKKEGD